MSRVRRASTAAALTYVQFGLSLVVGIVLVPFILERVGVRIYGYWLASGEVLAYAAMADFGVLSALPWMIAEADGRGDRARIRQLISTGMFAAAIVSLVYLLLVALLWQVAPGMLRLSPAERDIVNGPLAFLAGATALLIPLRVLNSTLAALQDVKVHGALGVVSRLFEVGLVVTLLFKGFGLYALAAAATMPAFLVISVSLLRLRAIAPDLLRGLPLPSVGEIAHMFREGMGAWLGGWGWRLTLAADALILTTVGGPVWVTVMAMTAKLGQMLTQMSWVPGDSGMVGLANLAGEGEPGRVRAASAAVLRVYLALASSGAAVVLAVNAPFVRGWLGAELFGGASLNVMLALMMVSVTLTHGLAAVGSVLGNRVPVGIVTFAAALVQVPLAYALARTIGLPGVPLASVLVNGFVLTPLLIRVQPERAGLDRATLVRDVGIPWALRAAPVLVLAAIASYLLDGLPLVAAIGAGGVVGVSSVWIVRRLLLDYPPVTALVETRLAQLRATRARWAAAPRAPLP